MQHQDSSLSKNKKQYRIKCFITGIYMYNIYERLEYKQMPVQFRFMLQFPFYNKEDL